MLELELKNISLKRNGCIILEDISMKISGKGLTAIIGPNGGGKTTLLKCILGVTRPSAGSIFYNGKPITRSEIKKIGYVPQINYTTSAFPISVRDVVLMGRLRFKGAGPYSQKDHGIAEALMEKVGINALAGRNMSELSGGERQRTFIARALACEPEILLLDEPTSNVDSSFEAEFNNILKSSSIPVLMATHDIGVISSLVDKVLCLNVKMFAHDSAELLSSDDLDKAYHCPVEIMSHGKIPHRVLKEHKGGGKGSD